MEKGFKFSTSVVALPLYFVLLIWIVFWIENICHFDFGSKGILPRTQSGLQGIIFSPFIHSNFKHLINNSLPLLTLLTALRYFYRKQTFAVIFWGIILSGFITWLIGRQSYHIGASGLIYVLVSFIFFKGIFTKYFRLIALSLAIVVWYGSMVWYLFPSADASISWEGHLAGFVTGLILAYKIKYTEYQKPVLYDWQKPDYDPENDAFMKNFDQNGNFIQNTDKEVVNEGFL